MEDNRLYIIKDLAFWKSGRAHHLFKLNESELDDAMNHPQGLIREEEDRVLVLKQDTQTYILDQAKKGKVSEVLKRHNAKRVNNLK